MRQAYIADDGTEFGSQEACERYENMHELRAKIEYWAKETYKGVKGQATKVTNNVIAWETVREEILARPLPELQDIEEAA